MTSHNDDTKWQSCAFREPPPPPPMLASCAPAAGVDVRRVVDEVTQFTTEGWSRQESLSLALGWARPHNRTVAGRNSTAYPAEAPELVPYPLTDDRLTGPWWLYDSASRSSLPLLGSLLRTLSDRIWLCSWPLDAVALRNGVCARAIGIPAGERHRPLRPLPRPRSIVHHHRTSKRCSSRVCVLSLTEKASSVAGWLRQAAGQHADAARAAWRIHPLRVLAWALRWDRKDARERA